MSRLNHKQCCFSWRSRLTNQIIIGIKGNNFIHTGIARFCPDRHPERFIHFIHPVPRYCSNSTIHWCIIYFHVFFASAQTFVSDEALLIVYCCYEIDVTNILLVRNAFVARSSSTFVRYARAISRWEFFSCQEK